MSVTDHDHPIDPDRVAHARSRLPSADDASRLTGLLSLTADPVRLRLIYALDVVEELCVGDLALALGVSEDSVSYALRLLRTAGLLVTRKQGRVVYNRLPTTSRHPCVTTAYASSSRSPTPPVTTRPQPPARPVDAVVMAARPPPAATRHTQPHDRLTEDADLPSQPLSVQQPPT